MVYAFRLNYINELNLSECRCIRERVTVIVRVASTEG